MGWRGLALLLVVAGVGALGTLATGAAMGMHASELAHLTALMVPALVVTLVAIAVARPLLAGSSMRQKALSLGLRSRMRASTACVTSTGDNSRRR